MEDLQKEFIPYDRALRLKELGFDEPCFAFYRGGKDFYIKGQHKNTTLAPTIGPTVPTFSQAFRWFDDNTECSGYIVPSLKEGHFDWLIRIDWEEEIECEEAYSSRQEAELACLDKLIEIVGQKNNKYGR